MRKETVLNVEGGRLAIRHASQEWVVGPVDDGRHAIHMNNGFHLSIVPPERAGPYKEVILSSWTTTQEGVWTVLDPSSEEEVDFILLPGRHCLYRWENARGPLAYGVK